MSVVGHHGRATMTWLRCWRKLQRPISARLTNDGRDEHQPSPLDFDQLTVEALPRTVGPSHYLL